MKTVFFPDLLDRFTEDIFIEKVSEKYHFEKAQTAALKEVVEEMLPWMHEEAVWERRESCVKDKLAEISGAVYEDVVISLGNGVDCLQEKYTGKGSLLKSYMLETLASELLLYSYSAYNRYVQENANMHVARYYFPGSEEKLPLEMIPTLLRGFDCRITCNTAFCIVPKKSVVFIAQLTHDREVQCGSVCTGCGNVHCSNRVEVDASRGQGNILL